MESATQPARGSAPMAWRRVWQFPLLTAVLIVALDQATKHLTMAHEHRLPISVIHGFFDLVYVKNPGAAWGIFADHTEMLALISAVVFVIVAFFYGRMTADWTERCVAISLILGGIVGNLIDRLFYGGVVDFLSFRLITYDWPAFNIADSAICIGVGIYLLSSFLRPEHEPRLEAQTESAPNP